MKINIKIRVRVRSDGTEGIVMTLDPHYENQDTPTVQRYGRKLLAALEGGGKEDKR